MALSSSSSCCFLSPVCVAAKEAADVVLFSIKLGLALARRAETAPAQQQGKSDQQAVDVQQHSQIVILLVSNDVLVHQAVCSASGNALFRFKVPASVLEPAVVTAYVALCNEHGSVVKVVDTGKLLVLNDVAAAEVQNLFGKTTTQVQQLLRGSGCTGCTSTSDEASGQQQPRLSTPGLQRTLSALLARLGAKQQQQHSPDVGGSSQSATATTTSNSSTTAEQSALSSSSVPSAQQLSHPPDAAMLYAYEHFFVPFLRQWVPVFSSSGDFLQHDVVSTHCNALFAGGVCEAQIMQLLGLLVEHELWACSLYILGRYPALAGHVQRTGINSPNDEVCSPILLEQLRTVLQPWQHAQGSTHVSVLQAPQQPVLLQDMQLLQQQQQQQPILALQQQQPLLQSTWPQPQQQELQLTAGAAALHNQQLLLLQQQLQFGVQQPSSMLAASSPVPQSVPAPPSQLLVSRSPSGSDDSIESASEILVRLGLLQQARGEQEAIAELMAAQEQQQQQHQQQPEMPEKVVLCASQQLLHTPPQGDTSVATCPGLAASMQSVHAAASQANVHTVTAEACACQPGALQPDAESMHLGCLAVAGLQADADAGVCSSSGTAQVDALMQTGLRQRFGSTAAAGSLFSKQRKLSWEEEQAELVPKPPPVPGMSLQQAPPAEGWYPGSWQLPEPSSGLGVPAGGFVGAAGFNGLLAAPFAPGVGQACGMDDLEDPYSEPSYGAVASDDVHSADVPGSSRQHVEQQQADTYGRCGGGEFDACKGAAAADCSSSDKDGSLHKGSDPMGASSGGSKGTTGCCSDTRSSSSSGSAAEQLSPAALAWQPSRLVGVCFTGFRDPNLEASYLVFKNHGCSLLDATAGFLCTSMLLVATLRSLHLAGGGPRAWHQLLTLSIYAAFFFLPYIVMKLRLQVFLRWREPLLVVGRNLGSITLAFMAYGYLPMVLVWRNVIVNTLSQQIQNGFILPACQQVRLPAALMIALVHVPTDAMWLAVGKPFGVALLHSTFMQLSSVLVTLGFDAWCRLKFLQRYSGVTNTGGQGQHVLLQQ